MVTKEGWAGTYVGTCAHQDDPVEIEFLGFCATDERFENRIVFFGGCAVDTGFCGVSFSVSSNQHERKWSATVVDSSGDST